MIGGLIKSNRFATLAGSALLAGGLAVSPAQAADLGGDCCADLEERVAVLEATTARKGNRKVSLTISGWVTQQLMVWDDGDDSDAYVGTSLNDLSSRIDFSGNARIDSEWSAGYSIQISVKTDDGFTQDQNNDDGVGDSLNIEHNYMWIQSERLGRVSWGRQSQATDNLMLTDLSGVHSIFAANSVAFDGSFFLAGNGSGLRYTNIGHCHTINAGIFGDCGGDRTDSIRYDSPTIAGFVLSAGWGEDDFWDVALRYAGEFGEFKVGAAIGYTNRSDSGGDAGNGTAGSALQGDVEYYQAAFSIMHTPTGLFFTANGGIEDIDPDNTLGITSQPDSSNYYLKAGIRTRLNALGATTFYGEYGKAEDAFGVGQTDSQALNAAGALVQTGALLTGSEFQRYGVGIVQEIDAASMSVWAKWRHHEGDVTSANGNTDFNDLDMFIFGGVIFF